MNFKDPIIAKSSVKNGNKIQPIGKLCCYVHTMKYTKRILSLTVQTASEKEKERKRAENFRPVFRSDRSRAQLGKICEYDHDRSCDFTFIFFLLAEIPRVVQTQGTAGEESGEHEDDDDDRGYDGRAGE